MKITLVSVYESISVYGLRQLSSVLKQAGFETQMVFLPRETEGLPWDGFRYPYSQAVLDQLAELTSKSGLVGISLSTNYFFNAVQITKHLHRAHNALVVWGGIHPTVRPEQCLQYADLVCVGEGEEALCELAQRLAQNQGLTGVENMWYRENGQVTRTPLRPLQTNLDIYPYPDYDLETSFVLHQGRIQPMTLELLLRYTRWPGGNECVPTYETIMARGCSYRCAYCCNSALHKVYKKQWRVRRRSIAHVIGEVQQAITRFPGLEFIRFAEDEFISDPETLREFCQAYRQTLQVPFEIAGFRPNMVNEQSIRLLVDAGLSNLHMGIQTGSEHTTRQLYNRPVQRHQVLQAAQVLHQFSDRINPLIYDLIVDNPWESEEDQLQTLELMLDIPKPYKLHLFSLTLYPGTKLYERAKREGLVQNENDIYLKHYFLDRKRSYLNGLFLLFQSQLAPHWLLVWLMRKRIRRLNWVWLPYSIDNVFRLIQLLKTGWRAAQRGNWKSISRYLRLRFGRSPQAYP